VFWLRQVAAVTQLSLRTIPRRLGSSAVAVVGIAGVVIVFVAVLSMAEGFLAAMRGAGSPGRALVMRGGADDEMTSGLSGPDTDVIKQAPGIRREGGRTLASAELFVVVDIPKKSTGTSALVPMRGIEPATFGVRDEARLVEGRMFEFGTNEIVVGRAASRQFEGLNVGSEVKSGQVKWRVVGIFESGGTVAETELWCDARTLQGAYRRGNSYQSLLARLESPESYNAFKDWLTANPRLNVSVRREADYYVAQSTTLTRLIRTVGVGIAVLMGIGAVFGAVLTMYTAVSTRTRDRDAARARVRHRVGPGVGARRIAGPRRDRRRDRRAGGVSRLQRLPDLDDQLPDVQPGGVRLCRDAGAAGRGVDRGAVDGTRRRPAAGAARGAAADPLGAARTVKMRVRRIFFRPNT
jgi:putative ABC transport system permease protein